MRFQLRYTPVVQEYNPFVKELQGKRFLVVLLAGLACLGLAACQAQVIPAALIQEAPTQTLTPFQAQPPTPRPILSATPTLVPTDTPVPCLDEQGRVEQNEMAFVENQAPLVFRVYLPPCYGQIEGTRYPVLYLLHGQTFNDEQWDRLGIDEAADRMISAGDLPPFIIVMPKEANTFADIFESSFAPDLIEGLIPWIDANYLTCAERSCRAIGGLSRGGAWAFRLGFIHWELFGTIGLHSTPPFIGDPNRLPEWLRQIPADQIPRVYMDTGRKDWYLKPTSQLEELLVQYGVPHEWYLFNGTHDEAYWSAHVADYLAWYARPWEK